MRGPIVGHESTLRGHNDHWIQLILLGTSEDAMERLLVWIGGLRNHKDEVLGRYLRRCKEDASALRELQVECELLPDFIIDLIH